MELRLHMQNTAFVNFLIDYSTPLLAVNLCKAKEGHAGYFGLFSCNT